MYTEQHTLSEHWEEKRVDSKGGHGKENLTEGMKPLPSSLGATILGGISWKNDPHQPSLLSQCGCKKVTAFVKLFLLGDLRQIQEPEAPSPVLLLCDLHIRLVLSLLVFKGAIQKQDAGVENLPAHASRGHQVLVEHDTCVMQAV